MTAMSRAVPVDQQPLHKTAAKHDDRLKNLENDMVEVKGVQGQHTATLAVHTKILDEHTVTLAEHTQTLAEHTATLAEHTVLLKEHSSDLEIIKQTLREHTVRFDVLEDRIDNGFSAMDKKFDRVFKLLGAGAAGF